MICDPDLIDFDHRRLRKDKVLPYTIRGTILNTNKKNISNESGFNKCILKTQLLLVGHDDLVESLLEHKADPNVQGRQDIVVYYNLYLPLFRYSPY